MYLLVKAIFVAVEGGPGTLPSWELFKQQLGLPSGVGDPMRTSRHQSKNRYAWDLINLESIPLGSIVVFWIRDILYGSGSADLYH